jgi:secondary thiamine-phosphate synthase enzyme
MQYAVKTSKPQEFINISFMVREAVKKNGVQNGIVTVFVPHTTAGITINENADPDVVRDILTTFNKVFPERGDYHHSEGNSHAHMKASIMGSSCTVIIEEGNLLLGTWQGIYFCEFDGPRNRKVFIKAMADR